MLESGSTFSVVFPGQGVQRIGMGEHLINSSNVLINDVLDCADRVSGADVRRVCLEGVDARGNSLETHGQVASVALLLAENRRVAEYLPGEPRAVTGLSLGLWPALVFAKALSEEDCLSAVATREQLTLRNRRGRMVQASGVSQEVISELQNRGITIAVQFSETEVTLVGDSIALDNSKELLHRFNPKPLAISAGYHWRGQSDAQSDFAARLQDGHFTNVEYPVILNSTGKLETRADALRLEVVQQLTTTARWDLVSYQLGQLQTDCVVEIGYIPQLLLIHKALDRNKLNVVFSGRLGEV